MDNEKNNKCFDFLNTHIDELKIYIRFFKSYMENGDVNEKDFSMDELHTVINVNNVIKDLDIEIKESEFGSILNIYTPFQALVCSLSMALHNNMTIDEASIYSMLSNLESDLEYE